MTSIIEAKVSALQALTGNTGNVTDLENQWLDSVISVPAGTRVQEKWMTFLGEQGYTGEYNERFVQFLDGLGYTGTLEEQLYQYWVAGGGSGAFLLTITGLSAEGEAIIGDHASVGYTIDPDNGTETVKWSNSADPDDAATYGTGASPTDYAAGDDTPLYLHVTDDGETVSRSAPIRYAEGAAPAVADQSAWTVDDTGVSIDGSASGANLTFSYALSGIAVGVSINASSGSITGTPTAVSIGTATITATDQYGRTLQDTFTWSAALRQQATGGADLDLSFVEDSAISSTDLLQNWTENGNALTLVSISPSVPAALSISSAGVMTGTPNDVTADNTYTLTMQDEYSRETSDTFTLEITAAATGPAFWAATYDETTFEMEPQAIGTGTPTFSVDGGLLLPSADGTYVPISEDTAPWHGARWDAGTAYADDGTGVLLPEIPSLYSAPAYTNLVLNSNDATTGWTISSTSVTNVAGLQGGASDGTRVTAASSGNNRRTAAAALVIGSGNNTFRVFAKAGNTDYFQIRTASFDSTQATWFNITAGTVGTSQHTVSGIRDAGGGWFECMVEVNSQTDTSGFLELIVANADNSAASVIGEYFDFGNAECHDGKTIAEVRGSAPIITAGSTVSVAATTDAAAIGNQDNTEGAWYVEYTPQSALPTGNTEVISLNAGADLLYYDGTATDFESADGTNTAARDQAVTAGTTYKIGIAYGDGNMRVNVNGTWGTATTYDGAYPTGSAINFLRNAARVGLVRNIRRYDADYATAQTTIEGLM